MKVVILGSAAGMAQPAIRKLVNYEKISSLVLADLNIDAVERIPQELESDKVITTRLDITDTDALRNLVTGSNLVMNFVGPFYKFGTKPLETVIDAGVNYIDICDEGDVNAETLKLNDRAKEKGVTAIIGLGMSPGMNNILGRLGADALEEPEEIHTHWVLDEQDMGAGAVLLHLFHSVNGEQPTFMDGKLQSIKGFQTEDSLVADFGDPIGKINVYHLGHPEPLTIPHYIPGIKKVANRGGFMPESMSTLFRMAGEYGLAGEEPIEINGVEIRPVDFLLRVVQRNLQEKRMRLGDNVNSIFSVQTIVKGKNNGQEVSYTFTKLGNDDLAPLTSIPAASGAMLMLEGKINQKGIVHPEGLDAVQMIEFLIEIDYINERSDYRVERRIGDQVEIGSIRDKDKFPELYARKEVMK